MELEREIRRAVETGKVCMGYRSSEKAIINKKAKLVIIARDSPREMKERLLHLLNVYRIPHIIFPGSSKELGEICGRPHTIISLTVLDPGDSRILQLAEVPNEANNH